MRDFKFFRGSDIKVRHLTINDAIRYADYMPNITPRESFIDVSQMARERAIMEMQRSRSFVRLHRGRRPRN